MVLAMFLLEFYQRGGVEVVWGICYNRSRGGELPHSVPFAGPCPTCEGLFYLNSRVIDPVRPRL